VLKKLPVLVEQYEPFWGALPEFLVTVATDINWTEEQPCFDGIARALAKFYAVQPPPAAAARPRQQDAPGGGGGGAADIAAAAAAGGGGAAGTGAAVDDAEAARLEHRAKHVIYPALRSCLLRKTQPLFSQLSPCLSRVCLGKKMHFIYKWLKNGVFRAYSDHSIRPFIDHDAGPSINGRCLAKRGDHSVRIFETLNLTRCSFHTTSICMLT
jgi:hypothetical protein